MANVAYGVVFTRHFMLRDAGFFCDAVEILTTHRVRLNVWVVASKCMHSNCARYFNSIKLISKNDKNKEQTNKIWKSGTGELKTNQVSLMNMPTSLLI